MSHEALETAAHPAVDVEALIQRQVPLSSFTTLHVGGPARFLAIVKTYGELHAVMEWVHANHHPWVVLGKGSNVLASDEGFPGCVIINRLEGEKWTIEGEQALVTISAGMSLASLAARAAKEGWAGLEFACGIPATIGGAVAMNAGAHGGMIQDCLEEALVYTEGSLKRVMAQDMKFAYRSSRLHEFPEIVVEATFRLHRDPKALERVRTMTEYRLKTQPWKSATAGCFFRNPTAAPGETCPSAGSMIERSGLKGFSKKGAQVSPLHANFLVNEASAKAQDFVELCEHIRSTVRENFGCDLEGEVRYLDSEKKRFRAI